MNIRERSAVLCATVLLLTAGCTHKDESSSTSQTTEQTPAAELSAAAARKRPSGAPVPVPSAHAVTFQFSDVAVTNTGLLRLKFTMANAGSDPILCDASEFSIQLSGGLSIPADPGAEDTCDPDTVDPGSSGKAVMYFDLHRQYVGPVKLLLTANNAVIGQGTTQLH
ncbi:MAG: hypothetical protein DLM53_08325 [Candidatus Eremiobacter antarcticus]|nr:hypothetical protein [Candidatus Eremiobacteraeota bacterium]MBC5809166.1 hypothetical protein [Candidatus Eremiobacteraeota bacterium]PZR61791.1 MAG: hypothetical protein DLM53_08325 [Candidatus Eremiobacter sp. RRmetagenome_bin22]